MQLKQIQFESFMVCWVMEGYEVQAEATLHENAKPSDLLDVLEEFRNKCEILESKMNV